MRNLKRTLASTLALAMLTQTVSPAFAQENDVDRDFVDLIESTESMADSTTEQNESYLVENLQTTESTEDAVEAQEVFEASEDLLQETTVPNTVENEEIISPITTLPSALYGDTEDEKENFSISTFSDSENICGDNLTWDLTNGVLTISGTGDMYGYSTNNPPWYLQATSIKEIVFDGNITRIGDEVFWGCSSLTSIVIPDTVTSIGHSVFVSCTNLVSVTIPDSVTSIGDSLFWSCSKLSSISIPNDVTTIEYRTFNYCENLTSIYIPVSVTDIELYVFNGCNSLSDVYYAGSKTQWEAMTIASGNDALNNATIHFAVEENDDDTNKCGDNLTWDLTNGVLTISGTGDMYDYSGSTSIPWYSSRYSISSVVLEDGVTSIADYAFAFCNLTKIALPESLTHIGKSAFYFCDRLLSITIPDSVNYIGESAFYYCENLGTFNIPTSLTELSNHVFFGCYGITSVDLPNTITSIGKSAFGQCDHLSSITIPNSVTSIGDFAFCVTNISFIEIPNSVTSLGEYVFIGCTNLTSVEIPNSITSIEEGLFKNCSSLESVFIPDTVTSIGREAFDACASLKSIEFPDSVTIIDDFAFTGCDELTEIVLPPFLEKISLGSFSSCKNLSSVIIPDSVTQIESNAFSFCPSLISIDIPNSVVSMKDHVFDSCTNLVSVTLPNSLAELESCMFYECTSLTTINIPNSIVSIGDNAFYGCSSLVTITLPETLKSLESGAFNRCTSLIAITIPYSVTSISSSTFTGCSSLTTVTILNPIEVIQASAFNNCTSITDVYFYGTREQWDGIRIYTNNEYLTGANIHFMGEVFYIQATSGENGTISPESAEVAEGDTVTFTFAPDIGYEVDVVTVNGETVENSGLTYSLVNISENMSIHVTFKVAADGENPDGENPDGQNPDGENPDGGIPDTEAPDDNETPDDTEAEITGSQNVGSGVNDVIYYNDGIVTSSNQYIQYCTIPNTLGGVPVTEIGDNAFQARKYLESIYIPSTVTSIGDNAFSSANNLTNVYFQGTEEEWNAISIGINNEKLTSATIHFDTFYDSEHFLYYSLNGAGSTVIGYYGQGGTVEIPLTLGELTVTGLGDYAFKGNTDIHYVRVPNTINSFGEGAFQDCINLREVTLYFVNAWNLTKSSEVVIQGEGVIGQNAFKNCQNLKLLTLPNGIISIDDTAFENCNALYVIYLPKTIEYADLSNISSLSEVQYGDTLVKLTDLTERFDSSAKVGLNLPSVINISEDVMTEVTPENAHSYLAYTVTFDTNGGTAVSTGTTLAGGTLSSLPTSTKTGYSFLGWYTANSGGTKISTSTVFTESTTIYAQWTLNSTSTDSDDNSTTTGSSSSSSSSSTTTYSNTVQTPENGSVTASPAKASYKDLVILTITPDSGYSVGSVTVKRVDNGTEIEVTANADGTYSFTQPSGRVTIEVEFITNTPTTEEVSEEITKQHFSDVNSGDWFADAVSLMVEKGLMVGFANGNFEPYAKTSRGMIATILHSLAGYPEVIQASNFHDVSEEWFRNAVLWAAEVDIATGIGNNLFDPDGFMTREQLVVMLYGYEKKYGNGAYEGELYLAFSDNDAISPWAEEAVAWSVATGIVGGRDTGDFDPQSTANRAEVAVILQNFIEMHG